MKVGFAGFAKSFLAWNLAGVVEGSVIYADSRSPYRVWNRRVLVVERWALMEQMHLAPGLVCIDHDEAEVLPDVIVYGVTPDLVRVEAALRAKEQSVRPVVWVLVGYEDAGVPWPFPPTFQPTIVVPWDERQATAPWVGEPLTCRDAIWRAKFERLWEAIQRVAGA